MVLQEKLRLFLNSDTSELNLDHVETMHRLKLVDSNFPFATSEIMEIIKQRVNSIIKELPPMEAVPNSSAVQCFGRGGGRGGRGGRGGLQGFSHQDLPLFTWSSAVSDQSIVSLQPLWWPIHVHC